MDVVPPAGGACARLGAEAKIADTATTPAVIANAIQRLVKLDFDGMLDSSPSDTGQHLAGLADEVVQRTLGGKPEIMVNLIFIL